MAAALVVAFVAGGVGGPRLLAAADAAVDVEVVAVSDVTDPMAGPATTARAWEVHSEVSLRAVDAALQARPGDPGAPAPVRSGPPAAASQAETPLAAPGTAHLAEPVPGAAVVPTAWWTWGLLVLGVLAAVVLQAAATPLLRTRGVPVGPDGTPRIAPATRPRSVGHRHPRRASMSPPPPGTDQQPSDQPPQNGRRCLQAAGWSS